MTRDEPETVTIKATSLPWKCSPEMERDAEIARSVEKIERALWLIEFEKTDRRMLEALGKEAP